MKPKNGSSTTMKKVRTTTEADRAAPENPQSQADCLTPNGLAGVFLNFPRGGARNWKSHSDRAIPVHTRFDAHQQSGYRRNSRHVSALLIGLGN
jgi:hypothetical protein